jgi:CHAD domain-containing protein
MLAKNYQHQYQVFIEALHLFKKEPDQEIYHKLRLAVKNIRAMHQLIAPYMTASFMVHHLNRPFDKIFSYAGQVRKNYLNQQMAFTFELNDEIAKKYLKFIDKKLKRRLWLIHHSSNKKISNRTNKVVQKVMQICTGLPPKELSVRTSQFVSYKMALIQQLINEAAGDYNFHQIRLHIREIKTTLTIGTGKNYPDDFYRLIEESSKTIGEWHDRIEFVNSIKAFSNRYRKSKPFLQPTLLKVKKEISVLNCTIIPLIDQLILVYNRPAINTYTEA